MNGRVYDPEIGRFMSVDPVFQFPENTQSLNPYSYVLNNPLSLTDPSGEIAVVPIAILVVRAVSAAYALYSGAQATTDAAVVIADDTATVMQIAVSVGVAAAGIADVTPGDAVKNSVNAVRQVAKGSEKAVAKEAGEKAAKSGRDTAKSTTSNGAKDTQGAKPSAKSEDGAPAERGNSKGEEIAGNDEAPKTEVDFSSRSSSRSVPQIKTPMTGKEFKQNLKEQGYSERPAGKDGGATVLEKDGKKYSVYPNATSGHDGPTAQVNIEGNSQPISKIRLEAKPTKDFE